MVDPRFTSLDNCQPLQTHDYPGVYFLRQGEEVVYVGQSKTIMVRIADHLGKKPFDSVLIMPVPAGELSSVETYWIKKLKPALNRALAGQGTPIYSQQDKFDPRRVQIKGKTFWQIDLGNVLNKDGKPFRRRHTFADRREAKAFAKLRKRYGRKGFPVAEQLLEQAIEAANLLAPTGNTVLEIVHWFI